MNLKNTTRKARQVLLLRSDEVQAKQDEQVRKSLCKHADLTEPENLIGLRDALRHQEYDAFFCAWKVQGGMWDDALHQVHKQDADLPLIVLANAENKQRISALQMGAFDILAPPYQDRTILYLLEHASTSHQARALHSKTSSGTAHTNCQLSV